MCKKFFIAVLAVILVLIFGEIADLRHDAEPVIAERTDLSFLAEKQTITESDYALIFRQTGLGKPAVDALRGTEDFLSELVRFQEQLQMKYGCRRGFVFFPTTTAELLVEESGLHRALILPPLEDGDILLTKSTKTMLFRHGHAAICVDGENKKVAEGMTFGSPSVISDIDSWTSYATLLIIRPRIEEETIQKAVDFTKEKLVQVPYGLGVGLLKKDKSQMPFVDATHCSHLVWQAYKAVGVDIDSDRGWLVTPRDISRSDQFEVVFSFGFGEEARW